LKQKAEQWSNLPEDQKEKYNKMVEKDKIRYGQQLQDLLTQGYFIMPDGSKSNEHKKKIKQKKGGERKKDGDAEEGKESNDFDEKMLHDDDSLELSQESTKAKKGQKMPSEKSPKTIKKKSSQKSLTPTKCSGKKGKEEIVEPKSAAASGRRGNAKKSLKLKTSASKSDEK